MNAERSIRAAFRGTLGKFSLDAAFAAPVAGVTALFGPSGCGKTTVLRCIAGLERLPDGLCNVDGDVWQGRDGTFLPTHQRPLGYVFQEASLFPHLSVRRNLLFGAPKGEVKSAARFDEIVEMLGVGHLLDRSPRNLSGGERQRVAVGRALLSQPKLLLMDEPLAALDRATKDEIMPFLERLRDRHFMPIVYITHDIAEVERLADQIVLMDQGRVIASGPLADLQTDPALPLAIARDAAVMLDGVVESHDAVYGLLSLTVRGGRFVAPAPAAPAGERRRLRVVARDVSLARAPPGPSSILNILPGRIISARLVESTEVVAVVALGANGKGARLLSRLTRKSWDQLGLSEGVQVYALVKAVALGPRRGDFGEQPHRRSASAAQGSHLQYIAKSNGFRP